MKGIVGIVMVVFGVITGLYIGFWWAFVGGIVECISIVKSDAIVPLDVALAISRVMFSGLIGWASSAVLIIPGIVLLTDD